MAKPVAIEAGELAVEGPAAMAEDFRRRIVDGQFVAGQRVTERQVAALYRCSAGLSREVLHHLEKLGAITLSARRGARVVDERAAPPDEVQAVWNLLADLLLSEARRLGGQAPPPVRLSTQALDRSLRMDALERRLGRLGEAARNPKLAALLARTAMHLAIVAPDRLDAAEARLSP